MWVVWSLLVFLLHFPLRRQRRTSAADEIILDLDCALPFPVFLWVWVCESPPCSQFSLVHHVCFFLHVYVPFMCREPHLQQSFSLLPAFLCGTEYIKHFTCSRIDISCPTEVLFLLKTLVSLCSLWWEPRFWCLWYRHLHFIISAAIMLHMLVVFFLDSI